MPLEPIQYKMCVEIYVRKSMWIPCCFWKFARLAVLAPFENRFPGCQKEVMRMVWVAVFLLFHLILSSSIEGTGQGRRDFVRIDDRIPGDVSTECFRS